VSIAAVLLSTGCSAPRPKTPQSFAALLDLRGYDFARGESAPLTGQWDFLPGTVDIPYEAFLRAPTVLRSVPDLWHADEAGGSRGHGSGSYHLTVLLPENAPPLALHFLSASTSFRIEVDGKELVEVGRPSSDPLTARAAYHPGFARMGAVHGRVDIMVRVSNYVYRSGGLWFPIFLGSAETIEAIHQRELAGSLVQATALLVMGLILLLLSWLRRKDRALLYSGLFALLIALRVLVTGEYLLTDFWPSIPFGLLIRLEYLTVFLSFPTATVFFATLFPDLLGRGLRLACVLPSLGFALLALVLPLDPLTRSLFAFYGFALVNVVVVLGALLFRVLRQPDLEGRALLVGTLILALSAINDAFYSSFVWWTGNLAPWGFGVFVILQVIVVVRRLTSDFEEAEELLDHKDLLIKEIHHRVKNNLQVVASLVSLQSHRVTDPEMREIFGALRLRIISMGLVHEKLYGKMAVRSLDLGNYIRDLIELLVSKDKVEAGKVRFSIKSQPIEIGVDACVNFGLIVTELVTNALKHALLPKGGGRLEVEISGEGPMVSVLIEDDGPGFPPDFAPGESDSLGYKLITTLLGGGEGRLEILPGPGGRVRFRMPTRMPETGGAWGRASPESRPRRTAKLPI
jgi:two-component sensor histidine kinase